ncbi:cation diffusion facilitator family transporter [Thermodesulfobacteriota bacterium]
MPEDQTHYREGRNITLIGMVINIILIVVKIWGGMVARSQALVADGLHSVSDLAGDAVVLLGLKWGRSGEDDEHPFGHGRIETLASFIVGVILVGAAIAMGLSSGIDIYKGKVGEPTVLAIWVALLSIVLKEALYRYTRAVGERIQSNALLSNAWHHRSDALSSVAVLIGVGGAILNPEWGVLDSWAALIVSILIAKVGASFVLSSIREFIDTAPEKELVDKMHVCACKVEGVINCHDLKARTSGGRVFVELHITVRGDVTVREGHDVAKAVEICLKEEISHLANATVHVDPDEEEPNP